MSGPNMIFQRVTLLFAAFALLILAGCAGGDGRTWKDGVQTPAATEIPEQTMITPTAELPPVKVALLVPLSGKHAQLGQAMLNAAQMALFDVGYTNFELMPRDTKGTPEGAGAAAYDAAQNGAQLILGPIFAEEVRAAKPAARSANLNMITFSTSWDLADEHTFVMGFLPFDQVERIAHYAAAQNMKRIGLISASNEYGRTVVPAYQTIAARAGIQTTQAITIQESANAMASVQQFARGAANMDAIFMPLGGTNASSVAAMLLQSGVDPQVKRLGTGLFDDPVLARKPEMAGALFAAPSPQARSNFESRFQQTYGSTPPRIATLSYDATALAATLAQRGYQANNAPAFDRASITNPNGFAGLDGIFRFRQNGLAERGLAVLQFQNGQIAVVDPAPGSFQ
jgi:branched-chain amino acid transport system substrate-binding protein